MPHGLIPASQTPSIPTPVILGVVASKVAFWKATFLSLLSLFIRLASAPVYFVDMGIPLWREPTEAETAKSAPDEDSSAAARSSIRRQSAIRRPRHPNARARGANVLSSFHSQILDEIQRGISEPQSGVRSPVMNFGVSEDGVDLDASRREALGRTTTRPSTHRPDFSSRRARNTTRDQALFDILRDPPPRSQSYSSPSLTPNFAPAAASHSASSPQPPEVLRIRGSDIVPSIYAENKEP
ncbi:hypothetical protein N7468_003192 [Penicillium chermesinum]|uniref:Uncharacterized protein n=1 Tax=Penicillium chermesinum TaxID=63820 RepID=A0A9W9P8L1_9EURO|nr:uncharacterized protein N7468_003192 [Penicillium chermesinum]KAJ5238573.1 hypothetical protein N7468_003192 [Penicillium chermesinum]